MWFLEELMKLIFLWIFVLLIIYFDASNANGTEQNSNVVLWPPM